MISLEGSNKSNNKILLFIGEINVTDVLYWQEGSWKKTLSYFHRCIEIWGCQEIKERKHSLSYIRSYKRSVGLVDLILSNLAVKSKRRCWTIYMLAFILDTTRPKAKTILLKATQQAVFSQLICLLIFKVCKYIIVKI